MQPILASISSTKAGELELWLRHNWTVHDVDDIRRMLKEAALSNIHRVIIDGSNLESVDLSAAWTLLAFTRNLSQKEVEIVPRGFSDKQKKIFDIIRHIEHPPSPHKTLLCGILGSTFTPLGKATLGLFKGIMDMQAFFGQFCVSLLAVIINPFRLRFRSLVYHINAVGISAVPIVSLMAFLISIVLGYQGSVQLQRFGANVFTVNLVSISLLREMAVIITAIIVAGRSGSAFAAQIGVMQINEETDAMRTFGLDPFEMLVLPRILAILIALPLLTFIADIVGLLGTLFIATTLLHLSVAEFMGRLHDAVTAQTFIIGIVKAPVFALLIGMTGCLQGFEVRESAEEVGTRTTIAVVQSIFLVVLADALFSILFTWMNV